MQENGSENISRIFTVKGILLGGKMRLDIRDVGICFTHIASALALVFPGLLEFPSS